jgi:hypothetical protein
VKRDFEYSMRKMSLNVRNDVADAIMLRPWLTSVHLLSTFWHGSTQNKYRAIYHNAKQEFIHKRMSPEETQIVREKARDTFYEVVGAPLRDPARAKQEREKLYQKRTEVLLHPSCGWGMLNMYKFTSLNPEIFQEATAYAQGDQRCASAYVWAKVFAIPFEIFGYTWISIDERTPFMDYMALDYEDNHIEKFIKTIMQATQTAD